MLFDRKRMACRVRMTGEIYREEREGKVNWYNVAVNQVLTSEDDKNSNPQSYVNTE